MSFVGFCLFSVRFRLDYDDDDRRPHLQSIRSSSSSAIPDLLDVESQERSRLRADQNDSNSIGVASSSTASSSSLPESPSVVVGEREKTLAKAIEKLFDDLRIGAAAGQQQEEETCVIDEEIVRQYVPTNPRHGCFPSTLAESRAKGNLHDRSNKSLRSVFCDH